MVHRQLLTSIYRFKGIVYAAGILPESVQIRYDLLGTYVHERLQYTY